jgi:hypothetical protein
MARLPVPGDDSGTWGNVFNEFLSVEHGADGTLKTSGSLAEKANDIAVVHLTGNETIAGIKSFSSSPIIPTPSGSTQAANKSYVDSVAGAGAANATTGATGLIQLAGDLGGTGTIATAPVISTGAITNGKLAASAVSTAKIQTGAVTSNEIADGTITNTDISASAAIAKTKLDASTQTSLAKADTSLQSASNLSDIADTNAARTNLGLGTAATISSAAGGDLSGTLPNPTVAKINGVAVIGTPISGNIITATSGIAAAWAAPAGTPVIATVTSDQATTSVTVIDITGLGIAVGVGSYEFEYLLPYTGSVNGGSGLLLSLNGGGATTSFLSYVLEIQPAQTTMANYYRSAFDAGQAGVVITTAGNVYVARIRGYVTTTGAGTLQPRFGVTNSSTTTTIKTGAYGKVTQRA